MDDPSPDSFLLDWGSSVNMNEDLRRAIRSECDEIDTTLTCLKDQIQMEHRKKTQVNKDLNHAKTELLNLVKSGQDLVEGSMMNEQIQNKLKETLLTEIVAVVTPIKSPGTLAGENPIDFEEGEEQMSRDVNIVNMTSSGASPSEIGMGKYITKLRNEMKVITESIRSKRKELVETKTAIATVRQEIQARSAHIAQDQELQTSLANDVQMKRKEFEAEKQRLRSVKEAIQNTRKRCGDFAQQVADEVSPTQFNCIL
jgi:predicted  nucleic acid-binding Zn-ribbon protein